MTDAFTKYVELAAIPNKTEDHVAKVLLERWFCRFSAPTVMVSDQGRKFCNELVNMFWKSALIMASRYPRKETRLTGRRGTQLTPSISCSHESSV
jgi:hypothetical protein